jgi:hypothetical protein
VDVQPVALGATNESLERSMGEIPATEGPSGHLDLVNSPQEEVILTMNPSQQEENAEIVPAIHGDVIHTQGVIGNDPPVSALEEPTLSSPVQTDASPPLLTEAALSIRLPDDSLDVTASSDGQTEAVGAEAEPCINLVEFHPVPPLELEVQTRNDDFGSPTEPENELRQVQGSPHHVQDGHLSISIESEQDQLAGQLVGSPQDLK